MSSCIFCKNDDLKIIQKVDRAEIIDLYFKRFKIDISKEFTNIFFFNVVDCQNCKLIFFQPQMEGTISFYEKLQSLDGNYYAHNRSEFDLALKYINNEDSILEIGAGSALFAQKLCVKNYVGLEYNDKAIDEANRNGFSLKKESIQDFVSKNSIKFDIVCSFHVIEHVKNPEEFIKYSVKALKDGGKMIIAVPCADSYLTKNVNHVLNMIPHHISRWKLDTLKYIGEKYNLEVVQIINEKVNDRSQYFVHKYSYLLNKFFFPNKAIVNNSRVFDSIYKIVKKIDKTFFCYKLEKRKKYYGKNMMIILQK